MQLFDVRVPVPGIIGSRIKPDQQAHSVVLRVPREYFDVDTWRRFLPLRFKRSFRGRNERPRVRFAGDSFRKLVP